MKRLYPFPLLSLSLIIMWFLLSQSITVATTVLALIIGTVVPFILKKTEPEKPKIRNIGAIIRLTWIVLKDITRSNIAVFTIILGPQTKKRVADFIEIPLQLRNIYGLSVLAIIVTATPGTLWVKYDSHSGCMLLHVFDLVDEQEWVQLIKNRYESLLLEIFE